MSSDNNSSGEDFNSFITITRRYFPTNKNLVSGVSFDLVSGAIYKYTRKVKLSKIWAIHVVLLMCNNIPFIDEITILAYEHHKYILQIKESLFIKCDRPILKKNIN